MKASYLAMAATAAAVLFLSACNKPEPEVRLEFMDVPAAVPSSGGIVKVGYTLGGASVLEPHWSEEWISSVECGGTEITVTVEENDGDERTADITFTADGRGLSETLTITQLGKGQDGEITFTLSVLEVSETGVTVSIVPSDENTGYVALTSDKDKYDAYGSEQDAIDETVAMFEFYADYYGYSLPEFLEASGTLKHGTRELRFSGLEPDSENVLFVFAMTDSGAPASGLSVMEFKTEAVDMNGMTFNITCEVDGPQASAHVVPSLPDQPYIFTIVATHALLTSASPEAYMEELIETQIYYGESDGAGAEETIAEISWTGEQTFETSLDADTDYTALACSVTPQGLINSEIGSYEFRTGPVDPSENVISISIEDVNVTSASVKVSTSNTDPYLVVLDMAESWEGLSEDDTRARLEREFDLSGIPNSGPVEFPVDGLEGGTEYVVMAFGYDAGSFTTPVTAADFTTLEAGDPTGMTFDIKVGDITASGVTVDISGNPSNALYYWNICSASATADDIRAEMDELVETYMLYGYVTDRGDFMMQEGSRGHEIYRYSSLETGEDYKVYAFGVYDDGDYATDIVFGDVFRLQDPVATDAAVTLEYGKYFDGDEIAAAYPYPPFSQWADGDEDGNAVLPVNAVTSGNAARYYYTIYLGDISDPSRYSDNLIIEELLKDGKTTPSQVFLCDYDVEMTMLAVAFDPDGNAGKVWRKTFSLDRDGVSPPEEFDPESQNARASYSTASTAPDAEAQSGVTIATERLHQGSKQPSSGTALLRKG